VEPYHLSVLDVVEGVGRVRLEQLVTQEQPCPMQELGRGRGAATVETRDDQLLAHSDYFLFSMVSPGTIQIYPDGC
jgi:hypothetical protein